MLSAERLSVHWLGAALSRHQICCLKETHLGQVFQSSSRLVSGPHLSSHWLRQNSPTYLSCILEVLVQNILVLYWLSSSWAIYKRAAGSYTRGQLGQQVYKRQVVSAGQMAGICIQEQDILAGTQSHSVPFTALQEHLSSAMVCV